MTTQISGDTGVSQVQAGSINPDDLVQKLTLGTAQNATSGTSIDFTGIPTWAKRITVTVSKVSTNGNSLVLLRLGTSGGIVSTGYVGASDSQNSTGGSVVSDTDGLHLERSAGAGASHLRTGISTFIKVSNNNWVGEYNGVSTGSTLFVHWASSSISLGGELDRVRLTTVNGTDTFDAGLVNIMYEG